MPLVAVLLPQDVSLQPRWMHPSMHQRDSVHSSKLPSLHPEHSFGTEGRTAGRSEVA